MKTSSEGFQQCYNAQMAVDGEHQIIVATQVGPQASDQGQLVGMLDEINETFGVKPAVVLADAGYCNEPDLLELEDRGIDAHVALGREGKSQVAVDPARLPATGCVSKVVEIGFGASPSGLSFAAVRPRGQGFHRRLADRGFPIHRLCASGFGRKRGAPRGASALFRDTAARSVF